MLLLGSDALGLYRRRGQGWVPQTPFRLRLRGVLLGLDNLEIGRIEGVLTIGHECRVSHASGDVGAEVVVIFEDFAKVEKPTEGTQKIVWRL